jgi:aminoglycoside phosphotransferase
MHARVFGLITLRRELAARYVRINRLWVTAHNAYRRLHAAPVQDLPALRAAAERLDRLDRGRSALRRDLKALSD